MSSSPASVLVVISEVDSMGGVVEGETVLPNKNSLAIEKVEAELRQEYDVREARKRELEFLEKGGDPLDFKFGNAASVNIQSASFTNQHPDRLLTSEAKGSFGFTVSPCGDSIESSGRRGAPTREPSSADNLLLFDAEHEFSEGGQNSSQIGGSLKVQDGSHNENSVSLSVPKKSYKRRNRSRPNRDGTRLSSSDVNPTTRSSNGPRDITIFVPNTENYNASSNWSSKPHSPVEDAFRKAILADGQHGNELGVRALESIGNPLKQVNQQTISVAAKTPIQKNCTGANDMLSAAKAENRSCSCQINGFSSKNGDGVTNGIHVEVKESETCTNVGNVDSNANSKDQTLVPYKRPNVDASEFIEEQKVNESIDCIQLVNGFIAQPYAELNRSVLPLNKQVNDHSAGEVIKYSEPDARVSGTVSNASIKIETSQSEMKLTSEIDEDSILKQAEIIKANRKIMELPVISSTMYVRRKSIWDYVLEEMAWLANDFAQERIWKLTAAAQICRSVAFTSRWKKQGKCSKMDVKNIAHALAKAVIEFWRSAEERSREVKEQHQQAGMLSVQSYAVRFLKYKNHAEMPATPDQNINSGALDLSWDDKLTAENLFYTIPHGAMETYRKSVESQVAKYERIGRGTHEEVETPVYYDAAYDGDGDEGEINMHNIPSSRYGQKKRKYPANAYSPMSSLNVSIPTKRMRTATRRVVSPFNGVLSGQINKTDVSSGDTSSFQDDQTTLHYGSVIPNHLEVDSAEVSTKPKKKKKAKNLNVVYEQKWQGDSVFQHEQRVNVKKRSESHQFETNGSRGLPGQPVIKKPKIIRQAQDNSFDHLTSIGGSVPSPVASQLSNMSNPNKVMKTNGSRTRTSEVLKVPNGLLGSGTSWSLLEEQALVVLVHDLGPNWELISDAINSVLHFKCVFRNAKECKERHNILMDRTSGDGADSAEDSGSSQPYPSTLPGIPNGSARQLFQRLQGPMEEDTLKSHFEKIIMIGQKQHHRKSQDPKNILQPHSSHSVALSQVCPNNLNGGHVLTPPELCDVTMSSPDMAPVGYQGSHLSGLPIPSQSGGTPIIPSSGPMPAMQGSPNLIPGNTFSSSHSHPNSTISRNGRYAVPRSADEQQRMQQQYNHLSVSGGRNVPQSTPGGDRSVRVLSGGNGMGIVSRSMPMARPGLQGIVASTSSMVNSGSTVSPGLVVGSGQGSPMLRPHEALRMMRPDLQVPTGNSPGTPSHFGGLSPAFPNQTASPVSYKSHAIPPQRQHPQVLGPQYQGSINQQQAHAFRLAKERQLRHKFQQQQQKQLASSNPLVPPVQPQPQLPISSPIQNSSLSPSTNSMQQPKPSVSGIANQTGKQCQKQFSQANRQHPQHRQLSHAQPPQLKAVIGVGTGNMIINNQCLEKEEPTEHLIESQGLHGGLTHQPSRQHVPHHLKASSKQPQNPTSQSDNIKINQGNVPQQKPLHQKLVTQNSMPANLSEPVSQAGEGPNPSSSPVSLPHLGDVQKQQQSLQVSQTQPALPHQQQMPTLSTHQQQSQLLQSVSVDSYSRSSDSRLEGSTANGVLQQ